MKNEKNKSLFLEKENIKIFEFGKKLNGLEYLKEGSIEFRKEVPIFFEWQEDKIMGKAFNFVRKKNKIFCSVYLLKECMKYSNTLAPAFCYKHDKKVINSKKVTNSKLIYTSIVSCPSDKSIKNNLTRGENL